MSFSFFVKIVKNKDELKILKIKIVVKKHGRGKNQKKMFLGKKQIQVFVCDTNMSTMPVFLQKKSYCCLIDYTQDADS